MRYYTDIEIREKTLNNYDYYVKGSSGKKDTMKNRREL